MKKSKILLTFDYEIFLGKKSGTLQKCIIEPTKMLIDVFDRTNIKSTFFIDVLYYQRLLNENNRTRKEAELLKDQLKLLVKKGHRIELHLHPHWLNAKYENGEWIFETYKNYRLHNLSKNDIKELFVYAVQVLNSIAREVKGDYRVLAFRAGGLCVQPFAQLFEAFKITEIQYDSSVAPGLRASGLNHNYDFTSLNHSTEIYRFSDNVCKPEEDGIFTEVPITTVKKKFIEKIIDKFWNALNETYGDGEPMIIDSSMDRNFISRLRRLPSSYVTTLNLDGTSFFTIRRQIAKNPKNHLVFISHPKLLSKGTARIVEKLSKQEFDFITLESL